MEAAAECPRKSDGAATTDITSSTSMNLVDFYGNSRQTYKSCPVSKLKRKSRLNSWSERIEKRLKQLQSHPIPQPIYYGIMGPPDTWHITPTQQQALDFAQGKDLMVFACESVALGNGGKRQFLAAHPLVFFNVLSRRPVTERTAYEVIPVDANCKLYFDLEFEKEFNANMNGDSMTYTLIRIVKHYLKECFNLECHNNDVINLDSTTCKKFSKHLIFNFDNVGFKNNYHVGNFVRMIHKEIEQIHWEIKKSNAISKEEVDSLYVADKDGKSKIFCDMGVYTRNRNFRVYKATKLGKNVPLVLSKDSCSLNFKKQESQLFFDSLITYRKNFITVLEYGCERDMKSSLGDSNKEGSEFGYSAYGSFRNTSPYEELDAFVNKKVHPGYIYQWRYFDEIQTISYVIDKYRYCHNIGRHHKSNKIMIIANIEKKTWYQKCFDPDCRGYKSAEWPLPDSALPWYNMSEFQEADVQQANKVLELSLWEDWNSGNNNKKESSKPISIKKVSSHDSISNEFDTCQSEEDLNSNIVLTGSSPSQALQRMSLISEDSVSEDLPSSPAQAVHPGLEACEIPTIATHGPVSPLEPVQEKVHSTGNSQCLPQQECVRSTEANKIIDLPSLVKIDEEDNVKFQSHSKDSKVVHFNNSAPTTCNRKIINSCTNANYASVENFSVKNGSESGISDQCWLDDSYDELLLNVDIDRICDVNCLPNEGHKSDYILNECTTGGNNCTKTKYNVNKNSLACKKDSTNKQTVNNSNSCNDPVVVQKSS